MSEADRPTWALPVDLLELLRAAPATSTAYFRESPLEDVPVWDVGDEVEALQLVRTAALESIARSIKDIRDTLWEAHL